jgi:SP family facilitated glucose transporter-like MFS transporter 8
MDKAAKSLQWLRGNLFNVEAELAQIKSRVIEDKTQQLNLRDFLRPWAYKPILIGIAVMVFQQFSGLNAALFYSVEILQVAGSNLDALVSAVVVIITLVFIYNKIYLEVYLLIVFFYLLKIAKSS